MTPDQLAKSGTEHAQQRALFAWANMAEHYGINAANKDDSYTVKGACLWNRNDDLVPQLKWLHAIHNQGHGDAIRGAKAKAEGVKSGVWDIFLPVVMDTISDHSIGGLYIEMKVGNNKLTDAQIDFQKDKENDYEFAVCYTWQEARDVIIKYLGLI